LPLLIEACCDGAGEGARAPSVDGSFHLSSF
jgi:hypothetical protein